MPERLIVVNGMAGAGKTTLAAPLAEALGAALVSKDAIKEALADASMPVDIAALSTDIQRRLA